MPIKYKKAFIALLIFSAFNVALTLFRNIAVGNTRYLFLNWNLFLAWVPMVIAYFVYIFSKKKRRFKILVLLGGFMWLLFLPNTTYVLTDLIHLRQRDYFPVWYDLVLLVSYAINSLFLGVISLLLIHKLADRYWGKLFGWLFVNLVVLLSSFGVYLGRFLRWNSWDLVVDPMTLLADIATRILNPKAHPVTLGFTFLFFALSMLIYLFFYSLESSNHEE